MRGLELSRLLEQEFPGGTGAEIGVWLGEHAEQLLSEWSGTLLLVDIYRMDPRFRRPAQTPDDAYMMIQQQAERRLAKYGSRAKWMVGESAVMSDSVTDESLDFVYIDADHAFASVTRDLVSWVPKVKRGGLVLGHDYTLASAAKNGAPVHVSSLRMTSAELLELPYAVKPAVDRFAASNGHVVVSQGFNWGFRKEH